MKKSHQLLIFFAAFSFVVLNYSCVKSDNNRKNNDSENCLIDTASQSILEKWKIMPINAIEKEYIETEGKCYTLRANTASLCPTYGLRTIIKINSNEIINKVLLSNRREDFVFFVPKNGKLTVKTEIFDAQSNAVCVWGGEIELELHK